MDSSKATLLLLGLLAAPCAPWQAQFAPAPVLLPTGEMPASEDYVYVEGKCIHGSNYRSYRNVTVLECADYCSQEVSTCLGFEYTQSSTIPYVHRSGMECHLQDTINTRNGIGDCEPSDGHMMDLYIKQRHPRTSMGIDGYWTHFFSGTGQQWINTRGIVLEFSDRREKYIATPARSGNTSYWSLASSGGEAWWLIHGAPTPLWRKCRVTTTGARTQDCTDLVYHPVSRDDFHNRKTECSGSATTGDLCCDYDKELDSKIGRVILQELRDHQIKSLSYDSSNNRARAEELHNLVPFPGSCEEFRDRGFCSQYQLAAQQFCKKSCGYCHSSIRTIPEDGGCLCLREYKYHDYWERTTSTVEDGTCIYDMIHHYYWCKTEPGCSAQFFDGYSWGKCGYEAGHLGDRPTG